MFKITFQKDIIRKVIIVKWFYTWFLQSGRKMFILQEVMIQRVKTRKWDSSSKCNGLIQKMILGPDIRRIGKVRNHQCYILLFREKRAIRDDRRRNTSSQIDRADCLEERLDVYIHKFQFHQSSLRKFSPRLEVTEIGCWTKMLRRVW